MEIQLIEDKYAFTSAADWANALTDELLKEQLQESTFAKEQLDKGKDVCFLLDKKIHTSNTANQEYVMMAYSLSQPGNLERASVFDQVLEEHEVYHIHRIAVLRNGELIDKTPDLKIKLLDNENQSDGGVLNSSKKLNVTIKDLRLYDILIMEDTRIKHLTEKDFMRKAFYKYVWISPDVYWTYCNYNFKLINERNEPIVAKRTFFRDAQDNVIPPEKIVIAPGESYEVHYENYNNPVDSGRQIFPYIDFATQATWLSISEFVVPMYQQVEAENELATFAPELIEQLAQLPSLDDKIAFAIEYVQNHVRYIYNEEEMHGHMPQAPRITYENKQGDCKAKTMFLKVILNYLGVKSSIVLVNFNTDYYLQYYSPSPLSFNHVVVKVDYKGHSYFVDPTLRDEYGHLENRNFLNFKHYMAIEPNGSLEGRPSQKFDKVGLEEYVNINVNNDIGTIKVRTKYRSNRANNMRKYFKNTNNREILDNWYGFLFYSLNYHSDRNEEDKRSAFQDAKIGVVSDDLKLNELEVEFTATLPNAYYTDKAGQRFLMYFDENIMKQGMKDFNHQDFTYWHNFDRELYEIHIHLDHTIDTKEKFTIQECRIDNPYFFYKLKKDIWKTGGSAYITYDPIANLEIPKEDMQVLKTDYRKIADSNFGLGLDLITEPKGLLSKLLSVFRS